MTNIPEALREFYDTLPKFPDGRIDYTNSPKAAVLTCFVEYEGKILLLKRGNKVGTYKGLWNSVAGYLDELKPLEEKVNEELLEELGISKEEINEISLGEVYELTDGNINKTWIIHPVLARLKRKPDLKIDWEHTEHVWINPEEIINYEIVPKLDETLRKVI